MERLEDRCLLALSVVGPVDPATGFPRFYQDSAGLALEHCADNIALCGPPPVPNPAAPTSFPANFPDESFYFLANARMPTNGTGRALLVLAVEAAFANGPVAAGDQITFSRLRIRADHLVPGASYTVTHPYGSNTLTADALGVLNFTQDVGGAPGVFTTALAGPVGPFLTWDAGAPPGFIGDPAVDHTVTGSPTGNNLFRITGTNVGGAGVNTITTNLFSVIGKVAFARVRGMKFQDTNANGVKDAGEPGVTGFTINLVGTDALGNPVSRTTTTAAGGVYSIPALDPGTYTISEVQQPGWIQTAPASGVYTVTVAKGDIVDNRDFGNCRTCAALQADPLNAGKSVLQVVGGAGADIINVTQAGTQLNASINGRNFGQFAASAVSRILTRGSDGDDRITGGATLTTPALWDGGNGNDQITGGRGANIMIGGRGADRLFQNPNGSNGDIMIAGRTAYDANDTALGQIMQDWTNGTSYAARITLLTDPLNPHVLNSTTVFGDGAADRLSDGPGGLNWFFREAGLDRVDPRKAGQTITDEG